jgi:hypothetical protein
LTTSSSRKERKKVPSGEKMNLSDRQAQDRIEQQGWGKGGDV